MALGPDSTSVVVAVLNGDQQSKLLILDEKRTCLVVGILPGSISAILILSDDAIMAMFSANNKFLLEGVIKTDKSLVDKFQTAFSAGADSEGDESD